MGSEPKYKDDIWHGLIHFGLFVSFCLGYLCLPRVKDISDHCFHQSSPLVVNFLVQRVPVWFVMVADPHAAREEDSQVCVSNPPDAQPLLAASKPPQPQYNQS